MSGGLPRWDLYSNDPEKCAKCAFKVILLALERETREKCVIPCPRSTFASGLAPTPTVDACSPTASVHGPTHSSLEDEVYVGFAGGPAALVGVVAGVDVVFGASCPPVCVCAEPTCVQYRSQYPSYFPLRKMTSPETSKRLPIHSAR